MLNWCDPSDGNDYDRFGEWEGRDRTSRIGVPSWSWVSVPYAIEIFDLDFTDATFQDCQVDLVLELSPFGQIESAHLTIEALVFDVYDKEMEYKGELNWRRKRKYRSESSVYEVLLDLPRGIFVEHQNYGNYENSLNNGSDGRDEKDENDENGGSNENNEGSTLTKNDKNDKLRFLYLGKSKHIGKWKASDYTHHGLVLRETPGGYYERIGSLECDNFQAEGRPATRRERLAII